VPGEVPEHIWAEHEGRYRFAAPYAAGRTILDVACGSGYGAQLLAESGASRVAGVDASSEALALAADRFPHARLIYVRADAGRLPFAEASFDCATCFETIEHLTDGRGFLAELARVLVPGAILLLSTPNRRIASPWWPLRGRPANPYHCYEYTRAELQQAILPWFETLEVWGQRFVSAPWHWLPVYAAVRLTSRLMKSECAFRVYDLASGPAVAPRASARSEPRYFMLVCRRFT